MLKCSACGVSSDWGTRFTCSECGAWTEDEEQLMKASETTVTYTITTENGDFTDYTKENFLKEFEAVDSEPASPEHGSLGLTGVAYKFSDGKYYSFLKTVMANGKYV